jgi:hypothetical protein
LSITNWIQHIFRKINLLTPKCQLLKIRFGNVGIWPNNKLGHFLLLKKWKFSYRNNQYLKLTQLNLTYHNLTKLPYVYIIFLTNEYIYFFFPKMAKLNFFDFAVEQIFQADGFWPDDYSQALGVSICLDCVSIETLDLDTDSRDILI